ncbi:MAG: hypothetical protein LBF55_06995 [Prevotellaceae bacterium]|jgi:hypothetical protein|nr:hypothetical protein [Prevotellaceae bacterium]
MKQLLLPILFATFFAACDENSEYPTTSENQIDLTEISDENVIEDSTSENQIDLTAIRLKERPCETLEYVGKIGHNFDAALDSLRNLKNIASVREKRPLEVLFDYDNRQFYGIAYGECGLYADVLDTKGNLYLKTHYCPDENVIDEDTIFENNKTFNWGYYDYERETIVYAECSKIVYEGRIGHDFDAALDSLKRIYKHRIEPYGEDGYYVEKEKMFIVNFSHDDRDFFVLTFIDRENKANWIITNCVIDEKGNYFHVDYCPD